MRNKTNNLASTRNNSFKIPSNPTRSQDKPKKSNESIEKKSQGNSTMREGTSILIPTVTTEIKKELANAKEIVESSWTVEEVEEDARDQLMVAEYEEEIFSYMRELEVRAILPEIFAAHNLLTFFG